MKMKFLIFALILCLTVTVFCACGGKDVDPTEAPTAAPGVTDAADEPTDKGIFVTEDSSGDSFITLPSDLQGIELPPDEFGDDVTGVFESHPITEPEETEPEETKQETNPPAPTAWDPDVLPEDVFED